MHLKGIVYDWDGTLLDSGKHASLPRLEAVLRSFGYTIDAAVHERMLATWGAPGGSFITHAIGVDEDEAKRIYRAWELVEIETPYPFIEGALDIVESFHRHGLVQSVASSRHRDSLLPSVVRAPIFQTFACISCGDDTPYYKPDPRALEPVLDDFARRGIAREEVIFVGDTIHDIEAGKAAGLRTLVVETGPYRELQAALHPMDECDVIPSIAHLPQWVKTHCVSPTLSDKGDIHVT